MATLGNLAEELMIEILCRLPPESLVRFKSVCKSWYALINHPKFAAKHFSYSLQHTHVLLKPLAAKNSGKKVNIFSILKFPLTGVRSLSVLNLDLPFHKGFQFFKIRGHSHGLVCLTNRGSWDIFLCNPTTREFRKLPPSIIHLPEPPIEPNAYNSIANAVGFGYDSKSRDFKVVRVVEVLEEPGFLYPTRVEIYDLSKDRWREIETPVCAYAYSASSFEMYHQGSYYWLAFNDEEREIILSFDMSEELFGQILVPQSFEAQREKYRSMGVWNGSIVLFICKLDGDERTFDIWGMEKDESGGVSWSKILTIGPVFGIGKPLVFVSSDELLMEANEGQVILYNVKTQQLKALPIKGHPTIPSRFQATLFIKSLLSVKGGNSISYEF